MGVIIGKVRQPCSIGAVRIGKVYRWLEETATPERAVVGKLSISPPLALAMEFVPSLAVIWMANMDSLLFLVAASKLSSNGL